jgi:hypothetical protein
LLVHVLDSIALSSEIFLGDSRSALCLSMLGSTSAGLDATLNESAPHLLYLELARELA